jgi:hypothetical protein
MIQTPLHPFLGKGERRFLHARCEWFNEGVYIPHATSSTLIRHHRVDFDWNIFGTLCMPCFNSSSIG